MLRLDNPQVADTFNDGEWRFRRNRPRRNYQGMVVLAWTLHRERRSRGFGEQAALHRRGHAGKRKNRPELNVHERYNDLVDGWMHQINTAMPVYAPFARDCTVHTTLRRETLEEENVGGGAVHEVTCGSYKQTTRSSQRRLSISRLRAKDEPLLATFPRGAIGRAKPGRISPLTTKITHDNLPTDARLKL